MKKFVLKNGVHIKTNKNKSELNYLYLISLVILTVFSITKVGIIPLFIDENSINNLLYSIIFFATSIGVSLLIDQTYKIVFKKKEPLCIYKSINKGLLIALLVPYETSLIILSFGVLVASLITNLPLNIKRKIPVNGILVGWGLITLINYVDQNLVNNSLKYISEGSLKFSEIMGTNTNFIDILLGFSNDLGSSSIVLLIPIYLMVTKTGTIKYRIPIVMITTVFMTTAIISGINKVDLWYPLINICAGNFIIASLFIATDNETTPVTPIAQVIYALIVGILIVLFRYLTPVVDGTIIAIFIMAFMKNTLDKIGAISRFNFNKSIVIYILLWLSIIITGTLIGLSI